MESEVVAEFIESEVDEKNFGFWIYLMTDLIIFATLFSCFFVFHDSTYGGPSGHQLFKLPEALAETLILLTSSFTCSIALMEVYRKQKGMSILWFAVTVLLGVAFLYLEISEFSKLAEKGNSWERSAFLSSYFTLVGTHGLHISSGILWMLITIYRIAFYPLSDLNISRVFRMSLFWHFLDFVWIFIFTVVYGMGYLV